MIYTRKSHEKEDNLPSLLADLSDYALLYELVCKLCCLGYCTEHNNNQTQDLQKLRSLTELETWDTILVQCLSCLQLCSMSDTNRY